MSAAAEPDSPLLYFVCTGNSARSQMAEGWARALGAGRVRAASGGLEPSTVHPMAAQVMAEVGIDLSGQRSKAIDPSLLADAAVVVTLCGDARDRCPAVAGGAARLHWDLADPARAPGGAEERLAVFRRTRDEIESRVRALLAADGRP